MSHFHEINSTVHVMETMHMFFYVDTDRPHNFREDGSVWKRGCVFVRTVENGCIWKQSRPHPRTLLDWFLAVLCPPWCVTLLSRDRFQPGVLQQRWPISIVTWFTQSVFCWMPWWEHNIGSVDKHVIVLTLFVSIGTTGLHTVLFMSSGPTKPTCWRSKRWQDSSTIRYICNFFSL